jgi:hypothetical protein
MKKDEVQIMAQLWSDERAALNSVIETLRAENSRLTALLEPQKPMSAEGGDQRTEAKFRTELSALLYRFGARLNAEDHWQGYAECGEDVRITVELPWPLEDVDLGSYFDGEPTHD